MNRGGYDISVAGEAEIAKALRVARMFGLAALQATTEGTAQVDLQIAGSWAGRSNGTTSGFTGPQVTGTAKLRNVRVAVRGVASPVEIASADMQLLPDEVRVTKLNAKAADTSWTGSLEMPRGCGTPGACEVHFILNANQIALGELSEWVNPSPKQRPWYRVLESNPQAGPSFLASLRASGQVTADRLQLQSLAATRVSAKVSLDGGKLQISELNGGFSRRKASRRMAGRLQREAGGLQRQREPDWSFAGAPCGCDERRLDCGHGERSYEVKGPCPAEFWTSAEGTLQFEMKDGALPHVALARGCGTVEGHASGRTGATARGRRSR